MTPTTSRRSNSAVSQYEVLAAVIDYDLVCTDVLLDQRVLAALTSALEGTQLPAMMYVVCDRHLTSVHLTVCLQTVECWVD